MDSTVTASPPAAMIQCREAVGSFLLKGVPTRFIRPNSRRTWSKDPHCPSTQGMNSNWATLSFPSAGSR